MHNVSQTCSRTSNGVTVFAALRLARTFETYSKRRVVRVTEEGINEMRLLSDSSPISSSPTLAWVVLTSVLPRKFSWICRLAGQERIGGVTRPDVRSTSRTVSTRLVHSCDAKAATTSG